MSNYWPVLFKGEIPPDSDFLCPGRDPVRDPMSLREKIVGLEKTMLAMPEKHIKIETRHFFADGMYAREIVIPAGTTLTGKIHKTQHINVISQGEISVLTDEGVKRLKAPCTFVASPGTKRVGYAHEDTVWTTFHASKETDLDKLEEELIAPSFEALVGGESPKLEGA